MPRRPSPPRPRGGRRRSPRRSVTVLDVSLDRPVDVLLTSQPSQDRPRRRPRLELARRTVSRLHAAPGSSASTCAVPGMSRRLSAGRATTDCAVGTDTRSAVRPEALVDPCDSPVALSKALMEPPLVKDARACRPRRRAAWGRRYRPAWDSLQGRHRRRWGRTAARRQLGCRGARSSHRRSARKRLWASSTVRAVAVMGTDVTELRVGQVVGAQRGAGGHVEAVTDRRPGSSVLDQRGSMAASTTGAPSSALAA